MFGAVAALLLQPRDVGSLSFERALDPLEMITLDVDHMVLVVAFRMDNATLGRGLQPGKNPSRQGVSRLLFAADSGDPSRAEIYCTQNLGMLGMCDVK
jgi:hypothetical protein